MHIESDIKLGFKDVMLRPKRSTLSSRSEVSLIRKFKFLHSSANWEGIPIMAANMDTTGTMEMAKALASHKLFTAIHKHYTPAQWKTFMEDSGESITETLEISGNSEEESELPKNYSTIYTVEHSYTLADTFEKRQELISLLQQQKTFCFDSETTGLDVFDAEIVGLSFAWKKGEAWFVSVPKEKEEAHNCCCRCN